MANPNPAPAPAPAGSRAPVIRTDPLAGRPDLAQQVLRVLPAWFISVALHAVLLTAFFFLVNSLMARESDKLKDNKKKVDVINSAVEPPEKEPDLTTTEIGLNPDIPPGYDVPRDKEPVDVPGPVDPNAAIGIAGAPEGPPMNVPPPPGFGKGQGGSIALPGVDGTGKVGDIMGGYGNIKAVPGGFAGRSGSTRERRVIEGGGNKFSEAAVAQGLQWLALHQCEDGHWSLKEFNKHYRPDMKSARRTVNETGQANDENDMAGTAFGILPYLAAGKTHKATGDAKEDIYLKEIDKAVRWMCRKQAANGDLSAGAPGHHHMYTHGLATIALCEAYGLTNDPALRRYAQAAINFIEATQNKQGGWRYTPKAEDSDTSVVGWMVMGLKSGQMSGLSVKTSTLDGIKQWLDKCENTQALKSEKKEAYGYGYTGPQPTPAMTAVALLCRQYLGTPPRNPGLLAGVSVLKRTPPGRAGLYYDYYATQVMHHMGGDSWDFWNDGPTKNKDGIRDIMIAKQDKGMTNGRPTQVGSWEPDGSSHGAGGRVMQTSLSLLTLEVYYRHLPLYRRDTTTTK